MAIRARSTWVACARSSSAEGGRLELTTLYGLFFVVALLLCVFPIINFDFGFHLKAGELIGRQGSIPDRDVFSFVAEGRPWVDSQWLFQLLLHGLYSVLGLPGLILLRATLVVAIFAFAVAACRSREHPVAVVLVGLVALFACTARFLLRPELISILFLSVFFYLAERVERAPRRAAPWIFVCQLLWVNMHGLHVLGPALLGLYLVGDGLQYHASRRWRFDSGGVDPQRLRALAMLVAIAAATLLLNANGMAGIRYPFGLFLELRGDVGWFPSLPELRPSIDLLRPLLPDPVLMYFVLVALWGASTVANWRRLRLAHVFAALVFLYLSLVAVRNIPLFAVLALPITVRNLSALLDRAGRRRWALALRPARGPVTALVCLGMAAIAFSIVDGSFYRRLGWRYRVFSIAASERFPKAIAERLRTLEGNVWNSPGLGGYLIWQLWPEKQVATDGRWELYGPLLWDIYAAERSPAAFAQMAERHDVRAIVLHTREPEIETMTPWLRRSRDWRLSLRTPNVLLFERVAGRETDPARARSSGEAALDRLRLEGR